MTTNDIRPLLDDCVHCGFCLPTCPTYQLWGEEPDSPRGRILLMDLVDKGELAITDQVVEHWDRCLGCMACVTSCPSGVKYNALIESTRAKVEREYRRGAADRLRRAALFQVLPYHRRLRPRRLRAGAEAAGAEDRAEAEAVRHPRSARPCATPAAGEQKLKVAMLLGCVQRAFFGDVNAATARVLAAYGCEVLAPRDQGCCGALELHTGRAPAERRRTALLDRLDGLGVDRIVVNSAGCGSALKEAEHPRRGEGARRARGAGRARAAARPEAPRPARRLPRRLPPGARPGRPRRAARGARGHPRRRSCSRSPTPTSAAARRASTTCCRARPRPSSGVARPRNIDALGADVIAAANPGCLIQITAYLERPVPTLHPVQLLDRALRG